MCQLWIVVGFLLLGGVWVPMAHAGPILSFSDPNTFLSAVQIVRTETFDEFQSNTDIGIGIVTLDRIVFTSSNPSAIWFVTDTFVAPSPPNSLVTRNVIAAARLTFEGGGFTDAIGFFLVGVGGIPLSSYQLDVVTVNGNQFTEAISPGAITTQIFRGFASAEGIVAVAISPLEVEGNISNFELDNVSRGAINSTVVPGAPPLMLITTAILLGLGYAWRRRVARPQSP